MPGNATSSRCCSMVVSRRSRSYMTSRHIIRCASAHVLLPHALTHTQTHTHTHTKLDCSAVDPFNSPFFLGHAGSIPIAAPSVAAEDRDPKASAFHILRQMELRPAGMSAVAPLHSSPTMSIYNPPPLVSAHNTPFDRVPPALQTAAPRCRQVRL